MEPWDRPKYLALALVLAPSQSCVLHSYSTKCPIILSPLFTPLISGVYSPEYYSITPPQAIITLPTTGLATHTGLFTVLPPDLQEALRKSVRD